MGLTTVRCSGCSRMVTVEESWPRSAKKDGRPYIVFCSRRCNLHYVAEEGTLLQEFNKNLEIANARRPDSNQQA